MQPKNPEMLPVGGGTFSAPKSEHISKAGPRNNYLILPCLLFRSIFSEKKTTKEYKQILRSENHSVCVCECVYLYQLLCPVRLFATP